jgi:hypothetical protein
MRLPSGAECGDKGNGPGSFDSFFGALVQTTGLIEADSRYQRTTFGGYLAASGRCLTGNAGTDTSILARMTRSTFVHGMDSSTYQDFNHATAPILSHGI